MASAAVIGAGLAVAGLAPGTAVSPASAAGAAPAVGDPGVMAPVDRCTREPTPENQRGVVGTGTSSSAPKPQVWDLAEIGDRIYVAGTFTGVQRNGDDPTSTVQAQSYLAAFDRDSGAWISDFRPTFNKAVEALAVSPSGKLLVGGEFTTANGQSRTGLVMLDPITGATVPGFRASIEADTNPMVRRIVRDGSQIYVAGQIARVNVAGAVTWVWNAVRLDGETGALDTTWIPKYMGGLWDIAIDRSRNRVHAAGFFTSIDGQPGTARMGTVSRTTGAPVPGLTPFQNNAAGQMDTVAVVYAQDRIYVGGAEHIVQVLDADTNTRLDFHTVGIACDTFEPACGYAAGGDIQVLRLAAGGTVLGGCHCYAAYNQAYVGRTHFTNSTKNRIDKRFTVDYRTTDALPASSFVPGLKQNSIGTYALFTDSRGCLYVGGDYTRTASGAWIGGFGRFCKPVAPAANLTGSSANQRVTLSWQPAPSQLPAAYYKVFRDGTFLGDTFGLSFGVSGLTVGSTYHFTVKTMDVSGRLSEDAAVDVTVAGPDTQAPTVPGAPTATVAGSAITISWAASTDLPDPGAIGLSGYLIHRDWQFVKFVPAGTTTFSDPGLDAGAHRYDIRAIDLASNMSAPATVTATIADSQAPTTPGAPAANVAGSSITLTWSASTDRPDPGGIGLSGYLIHRDWQFVKFVPAGTTTFTDNGLKAGPHRYDIRAVDHANNISAPATVTPTIPDTQAPTVPGNPGAAVNGSTVTLTWSPSVDLPDPDGIGLSGYLIHRDWQFVTFVPAGTTTFSDTAVAVGSHRYEIRAVDRNNNISAPTAPLMVQVG